MRRPSTAWRTRACGVTSRPAPSSRSKPAATTTSAASRTSSASSSLAATSTGSVDSGPATAARASSWAPAAREAIDARPEHAAHRVGQLLRAGVAAARDQLGEEERVAAGRRAQVGGGVLGSPGEAQQLADGVGVERADGHAQQLVVAGQAHQQAVELGVRILRRIALGGEDQHPAAALVAQDVLEQLDRAAVGPLDVVDDEQDRTHRRLRRQHLGDRLEQQVALDLGGRQLGAHRRHELQQLGQQHGQRAAVGDDPLAGPRRHRQEGRAQRLHERLERHQRLLGGPSPQHRRAGAVDRRRDVGGDARLAGAGLADHHGERGTTGLEHGRPRRLDGGDLALGARRASAPRRRAVGAGSGSPGRSPSGGVGGPGSALTRRRGRRTGQRRVVGEDRCLQRAAAPASDRAPARRRAAPACGRRRAARRPAAPSGTGRASAGARTPRAAGARRSSARARWRPRRPGPAPAGRRSGPRWRASRSSSQRTLAARAHSSSATSTRHGPRHSPSAASSSSRAAAGSSSRRAVAVGDAVLEAVHVEHRPIDVEHVAGTVAADEVGAAEGPAQQRDVALHGVRRRRRRFAAPTRRRSAGRSSRPARRRAPGGPARPAGVARRGHRARRRGRRRPGRAI